MNYIESAGISIETIDGNYFEVDLSPLQLAIICKILGIQFKSEGEMLCFSDDTLKKLCDMKGNPLKLKEIKGEEL